MTLDRIIGFGRVAADLVIDADVVIVGTGPGGAAAAARLSENGKRVVMLEGGSYLFPGTFPQESSESSAKLYIEDGQLAAASPTGAFVPLAAGKGVGGSSLINSAMCFRGTDDRLNEWSEWVSSDRVAPQNMARLYDEIEETLHVTTTPTAPEVAGQNNLVMYRGIQALGWDGAMCERNAPGCVGCGVCFLGCPVGGKGSVDRNFIAQRALNHDTTVYADTWCEEIIIENGRAVGVRGTMVDPVSRNPGPRIEVRASKVILAGGTIGTAKLLLKTEVSANEHIGKHLHFHPTGCIYGLFDHPIEIWKGVTQGVFAHKHDEPGLLLESFSVRPEVFFSQGAEPGSNGKEFFQMLPYIAGCGYLLRDESEGTMTLGDRGKSVISYDLTDDDLDTMRRGFKMGADVYFAAGVRKVKLGLWYMGYVSTPAEVDEAIARIKVPNDIHLYGSHLQSSCRMASSPEDGVVDSRGQVFDVPGLFIADSSTFPSALGRNPQMTVAAMALNVAEQMLEDW
ncbi:MAG: GMC family oxidoreductase [Myxococcales bacterium]|nr:GMC family oxidoreductase [Myxococcales bacterium]